MKKVHNRINGFISKIAFVIENSINIISEDRMLLIYLISSFTANLMIKVTSEMPVINVRSFLFNFAWFSIVTSLSYLIKTHKRRFIYFIGVTTFSYASTFANIMYFRYYENFLSLSIVKQLSLFAAMPDSDEMGSNLLTNYDILFWIFYIISILLLFRYAKQSKIVYNETSDGVKRFNRITLTKMAGITFFAGIIALQGAQYSQVFKLWNRPIVVENFGLANYHIVDTIKSMSMFIEPNPSKSDYRQFLDYFESKNKDITTNEYTGIFENKNVIVIHAESIEHLLINREFNEQMLTPNINKLANTGYYYSNMYSQESVGTSADSEFTFNASLLPVNNGTIFLTHFDRTYITTQKLLGEKGYQVFSLHGNNGAFWNRSIMHPQLGYDMLYDKDFFSYKEEDVIGLGISDEEFFSQSVNIINDLDTEPYYATLITLTNHTPWGDTEKYITYTDEAEKNAPLDCGDLNGELICDYFKAAHYADYAVGQFMKKLEKYKMLEDTIVVLYGDHPANIPITDLETLYDDDDIDRIEYKAQQKVPFIIWSKDIITPVETKTVMGMLDAGPTLQNMLGIRNEFNLGSDVHAIKNNIVPFNNGDWTDGTIYFDSFRNDYTILKDTIDKTLITEDFIESQTKKAHEMVTISNLINKYNLIEYHYEETKEEVIE